MNESKPTLTRQTLDWIEKRFSETWEPIETNINFESHFPISKAFSLHVYEERYNIEGKTYRLLYPIDDKEAEPLIEILL
jgi:hypothetical protein